MLFSASKFLKNLLFGDSPSPSISPVSSESPDLSGTASTSSHDARDAASSVGLHHLIGTRHLPKTCATTFEDLVHGEIPTDALYDKAWLLAGLECGLFKQDIHGHTEIKIATLLCAILSNAVDSHGRRFAASFILAFEDLPGGLEIVADWWISEILFPIFEGSAYMTSGCSGALFDDLLERQLNFDPITRTSGGIFQPPPNRRHTKGTLRVQEIVPSKLGEMVTVSDTLEHWCDTVIEDLAGAGNAILASYEIANPLSLLCMWMEPVERQLNTYKICSANADPSPRIIDYMNPAFNPIQSVLLFCGFPALYSPIAPTAVYPATYLNESCPARDIPLPDPRLFVVAAAIGKLVRDSEAYPHMMSTFRRDYDRLDLEELIDTRTRLGLKQLPL